MKLSSFSSITVILNQENHKDLTPFRGISHSQHWSPSLWIYYHIHCHLLSVLWGPYPARDSSYIDPYNLKVEITYQHFPNVERLGEVTWPLLCQELASKPRSRNVAWCLGLQSQDLSHYLWMLTLPLLCFQYLKSALSNIVTTSHRCLLCTSKVASPK